MQDRDGLGKPLLTGHPGVMMLWLPHLRFVRSKGVKVAIKRFTRTYRVDEKSF
jgi:hypothetical protein